jgi:hypothetical protein
MNVVRRMEFKDFFHIRSPFLGHECYTLLLLFVDAESISQYECMILQCLFSIMIHKSDLTSFFIASIRFIKKGEKIYELS